MGLGQRCVILSGLFVSTVFCGICDNHQKGDLVGCIARSLTKSKDDQYLIEFHSNASITRPNDCFQTCTLIYPDSTIALLNWNHQRGLDCQCGSAAHIDTDKIGPGVFCNQYCDQVACGGHHQFQTGQSESYFSAFCLKTNNMDVIKRRNGTNVLSRANQAGFNETDAHNSKESDEVLESLRYIWLSINKTNVLSIVMIGLLVVVIILVLIVLVWLYHFMEALHMQSQGSAFYRTGSSRRTPLSEEGKDQVYGATNRAFDPEPNQEGPFGLEGPEERQDSRVKSAFYEDSASQQSTETEPADEVHANGK